MHGVQSDHSDTAQSTGQAPVLQVAVLLSDGQAAPPPEGCSGGLCVGMHGGPHEGGPASYPVADGHGGFTSVSSTMTVPAMPAKIDGICCAPRPRPASRNHNSLLARRRTKRPISEKDVKLVQKLVQLQPFIAALLQECVGQLGYFGPR